jgi:acyl-CoA thioester hydrolase
MIEALRDFRFHHPIQVRYSDMDMLGHANNAVYLTYLELARIAYFRATEIRSQSDTALVLAHAGMDFKIPLTLDVEPVAHLRTVKFGNSSMTMENVITDRAHERQFYTASLVLVAINTQTGRPVPIPEAEKQKIIAYEPALV